jgi:GAF domain-containing protein
MPGIDPSALSASLSRLEETYREDDLEPHIMLKRVVDAADELFGLSGAGLMFIDSDEALRYVMASDETIALLEEAQEELGEGPCVDTFVYDTAVQVYDLLEDKRWPLLSERVGPRGLRAVLGVPVRLGGAAVGALNLYLNEPHQWQRSEVSALQAYATMVETMLGTILTARRHTQLAEQLQYALDYRVVIERGVGYLMALYQLDEVHAFDLLRRTARNSRRKVADVAREIIAGKPLEQVAQPN